MGICRCKENKPCSVHFFRKDANPEKYEIKKKEFTETGKVKKAITKKEDKLKKLDPCDCSNCDCDDCECIVCDC